MGGSSADVETASATGAIPAASAETPPSMAGVLTDGSAGGGAEAGLGDRCGSDFGFSGLSRGGLAVSRMPLANSITWP